MGMRTGSSRLLVVQLDWTCLDVRYVGGMWHLGRGGRLLWEHWEHWAGYGLCLFVSYMVGSGTQHVRTHIRARGSRVNAKTQDTQPDVLQPCVSPNRSPWERYTGMPRSPYLT